MEAWLKCQYMREHLGEEYSGVVSAVTSFGIFVTLDALYVEGLVHITELGGEYFKFDEARQELRGERTGIRYVIGARVRVQVSRVDLDGRKIDFRLVHEAGDGFSTKGPKSRMARNAVPRQRPWMVDLPRCPRPGKAERRGKGSRRRPHKQPLAGKKAAGGKPSKGRKSRG